MTQETQLTLLDGGREVERYDPEHGLKSIAVSEAAEKHWARVKDPTKLYQAIEGTLTEQRKFVRWWDGLGDKDGRPKKTVTGPSRFPIAGRNGMPERKVIERWRKRTADGRFERELAEAQEKCRIVVFNEEKIRGTQGTGEAEWFTPDKPPWPIITMARAVLGGIDLDPATHAQAQAIIQADRFFTKENDGLKQEWHGRVWLNPPYAQPLIAEFVAKMCAERRAGRVIAGIMLTHNYTDTAWFHEAADVADAICFTRGRVKFYEPDGTKSAPTQGQAFFYFGPDVDLFAACFSSVGLVVEPIRLSAITEE